MKYLYIIILLGLSSCTSVPKKTNWDYQNSFYIGCMNATLKLSPEAVNGTVIRRSDLFCKDLEAKLKEFVEKPMDKNLETIPIKDVP